MRASRPPAVHLTRLAGAAIGLVALAACGSGGAGSSGQAGAAPSPSMTESTPMTHDSMSPSMSPGMSPGLSPGSTTSSEAQAGAMAPFGPACSSLPSSGMGSAAMMAGQPVATAAAENPQLTKLSHDIKAAGLTSTLNSASGLTVFAPTDRAFASMNAMDKHAMTMAMQNPKGQLAPILKYHVIPMRLNPDQLAGTHTTLQGSTLRVTGSGHTFTVNGTAMVVCGDIHTSNGIVYLIDHVLTPGK